MDGEDIRIGKITLGWVEGYNFMMSINIPFILICRDFYYLLYGP